MERSVNVERSVWSRVIVRRNCKSLVHLVTVRMKQTKEYERMES